MKKKIANGKGRANRSVVNRMAIALRKLALWTLVLAAVAVGIIAVVMHYGGTSVVENLTRLGLSPVTNALTGVSRWTKDLVTNWRDYDELKTKYDEIEYENETLKLRLQSAEEYENENARLKSLLDASSTYEELDPIHAQVTGKSSGQWFYNFTVNKGRNDGVAKKMAVVTGDGLVGYISDVGVNASVVTTVIDTTSAVACLVQRSRDNGVMRGEVASNDNEAKCHVYYLPNVNNIVPGDSIITSGMDSLYPKGLYIGDVIEVSRETSSDGSYVVVAPAVDFMRIEDVMILRTVVEEYESLPEMPEAEETYMPDVVDTLMDETEATEDPNWHYPTSEPTIAPAATATPEDENVTPEPTTIEILPEDLWAE